MKWWFKIWKFIVIAAAVIMVWNDFNYEYEIVPRKKMSSNTIQQDSINTIQQDSILIDEIENT